jgi:hypothetical protein
VAGVTSDIAPVRAGTTIGFLQTLLQKYVKKSAQKPGYQPGPPIYALTPDRESVNVYALFELITRTCGEWPAGVAQPLRDQLKDMADLFQRFAYFMQQPEDERDYVESLQYNRLILNMGFVFEDMMLSIPEHV